MKLNKRFRGLSILLLFSIIGFSQTDKYEYYKEKFPKKGSINLLYDVRFVLDINKAGELEINRYLKQNELLIGKFSGGWNRGAIHYSSFEEIHDVEAATLVPNGTKYKRKKTSNFQTEKTMSNHVFLDDASSINFSYPEVAPGCIKSLAYREKILNPMFLPPMFLQFSRFTEKMNIELDVDDNISVDILKFNLDSTTYEYSSIKEKGRTRHLWKLKDIPFFEGEAMSPSALYFIPHIAFVISDYTFENKTTPILGSVENLRSFYLTMLDSVNSIPSDEMNKVVDSISNVSTDDLKKAQMYYNWVRGNIKYIAVEDGLGGFIPDNPSAVASKKYGDCKGMSYLLSTLMQQDNLPAYETWIGTRTKPYTYAECYTPYVDNHMISAFKYNNEWLFLDATDEYVPFGFPSKFIQGKEAMINVPGEKSTLVMVPTISPDLNFTKSVDTIQIEEQNIVATTSITFAGYRASFFKVRHFNTDEKQKLYRAISEKGNNKFQMLSSPTPVLKDSTVQLNFEYKVPDYVRNLEDKIYINLNLNTPLIDETLEDNRTLPIEFDEQQLWKIREVLIIPEGKKVNYVPEYFSYDDGVFTVEIKYTINENYLIYDFQIRNEGLIQPVTYGETWNTLGKKLRKQYRQTVELINK